MSRCDHCRDVVWAGDLRQYGMKRLCVTCHKVVLAITASVPGASSSTGYTASPPVTDSMVSWDPEKWVRLNRPPKCECGAAVATTTHALWCPTKKYLDAHPPIP